MKTKLQELEERVSALEKRLGLFPAGKSSPAFEKMVRGYDKRTLEHIWRENGMATLAVAIVGLKKDDLLLVKKTLSKNQWREVAEIIESEPYPYLSKKRVDECREQILGVAATLEGMGEIVATHKHAGGVRGLAERFRRFGDDEPKPNADPKLLRWKKDVFSKLK